MIIQNYLTNPKIRAKFDATVRSSALTLLEVSSVQCKVNTLLKLFKECSNAPHLTAYFNAHYFNRPLYVALPLLSVNIIDEDLEGTTDTYPKIYSLERNIELLIRKGMHVPSYLGQAQIIQLATTIFTVDTALYWLALQQCSDKQLKDINSCIEKIINIEGIAFQIKLVTDLIEAVSTFESVLKIKGIIDIIDKRLMVQDMGKFALCTEIVLPADFNK